MTRSFSTRGNAFHQHQQQRVRRRSKHPRPCGGYDIDTTRATVKISTTVRRLQELHDVHLHLEKQIQLDCDRLKQFVKSQTLVLLLLLCTVVLLLRFYISSTRDTKTRHSALRPSPYSFISVFYKSVMSDHIAIVLHVILDWSRTKSVTHAQ